MPGETAIQNQIIGLESGLKNLKNADLHGSPEFRDMYQAIDKHHRDIKLAHLTGKAKDLLQQAEQDTKFYYILVNMLGETINSEHQKESLGKVYSWYKKNQHVLHTKPHFGKKQDPKSILKPGNFNSRRDSESLRLGMSPADKKKINSGKKALSARAAPPKPDLEVPDFSGNDVQTAPSQNGESPKSPIQPEPSKPERPLSRVRFAPGSKSSRKGRKEPPPEPAHLLPKRKTQPLSALYNPHGRDIEVVTDRSEHNSPVKIHVGSPDAKAKPGSVESRIYQMRKWDAFQQEQSYGQEILSKMQHVGRSGAPGGVRYTAHENGLMAEDFTQDVISSYAIIQEAKKQLITAERQPSRKPEPLSKKIVEQSLEQFYETADNYYPTKLPKYPSFKKDDKTRIQSAPTGVRTLPSAPAEQKRAVSAKAQFSLTEAEEEEEEEEEIEVKSMVKLDTIVGMIDSITDEMGYYKEKLAPDPQPGFRQPIAEIDPSVRPQTAPAGTVARPASPEEIFRVNKRSGSRPGSGIVPGVGLEPGLPSYRPGSGSRPVSGRPGSKLGTASVSDSGYRPDSVLTSTHYEHDEADDVVTFRQDSRFTHQVVEAIDWRGVVAPESPKKRWDNNNFNDHTFVKKMPRGKSLRSAGKTHAGSRPKTAPMTPRERWATDKQSSPESLAGLYLAPQGPTYPHVPSDANERATSQAASHIDTEMDPETTADLIQVQHLGGKSRRKYRRQFLMNFDWSEPGLRRGDVPNPSVNMEFVSFIAPKSVVGSRTTSAARSHIGSGAYDPYSPLAHSGSDAMHGYNPEYMTESEYNPEYREVDSMSGDLDVPDMDDLDEELKYLDETPQLTDGEQDKPAEHEQKKDNIPSPKRTPHVAPSRNHLDFANSSDARRLISEINDLVSTPGRAAPEGQENDAEEFELDPGQFEVLKERSVTINPTTIQHSPRQFPPPALEHMDLVLRTAIPSKPPSAPPIPSSLPLELMEPEIDDADMALYLRAGGKLAIPAASTEASVSATSPRPKVFHRSFPKPALQPENRPSLAIEGTSTKGKSGRVRSAGRVPSRARSASRQEMLLRQNEMLKKSSSPHRTAPSIPNGGFQPFGTRAPSRGKAYMPELEAHARKDRSPRHTMEKVGVLRAEDETPEYPPDSATSRPLSMSLKVQRLKPTNESPVPPVTPVPSMEHIDRINSPERVVIGAELNDRPKSRSRPIEIGTGKDKKIIHVGRPIPRYGKVEDPDEYAAAVALQNETQAAVDIQRIFRGYVARNQYQYLQREERVKRENERMAAVEIQRRFRGHLSRKNKIYSRAPDKESIEWAKQYKGTLLEYELDRQAKLHAKAIENSKNKHVADSRIAVIGPHVEVYAPFHPKKTGIDKSILNAAATAIQRRIKGWLIRVKLERLKRKAKQHAKSWSPFIAQYKDLVHRLQLRMGIDKPQFVFSFDLINQFMDTKKRYESVFDKKSFSNELDLAELPDYFKECDLYPAGAEIEEAMDSLFRGQPIKKGRGLYKGEVLDITFGIYPPKGSGIINTRRSTWMHPIIDGEEALKLVGSENVESTEFKACWKLVAETKKAQNQKKGKEEEKAREAAWQKEHGQTQENTKPGTKTIDDKKAKQTNKGDGSKTDAAKNLADKSETSKKAAGKDMVFGGVKSASDS